MKKRNLPNLPDDESEVFNLVRHVREMNEPEYQEPYREPFVVRNLKNRINLFQSRMDDLVDQKRKVVKELKHKQMIYDRDISLLRRELNHLNERLKETECSLKEVIRCLRQEREHL